MNRINLKTGGLPFGLLTMTVLASSGLAAVAQTLKASLPTQAATPLVKATCPPPGQCPAASPKFSLAPGSYPSPQSVAISDSTPNSAIYYTVNGTTPSPSSTRYTGPITVSTTEKIEAVAVANGYGNSAVVSASYTIAAKQYPFAYVTNYGSSTLSKVDLTSNAIVGAALSVGTNSGPFGVAITPDQTKAYITNSNTGSVAVVNIASNSVIVPAIAVGTTPFAIAVTPKGDHAYVGNYGSNNVSVVDTGTNSVVDTISVTGNPFAVAITPDGAKAYVVNAGNGTVAVIQTSSNALCTTVACSRTGTYPIPVGSTPSGIAILPNGKKAYIANYSSNTVSVIDTTSDSLCSQTNCSSTGTYPVALPSGSGPRTLAASADGSKVYVVNQASGNIAIISTATDKLCTTSTCSSSATYPIPIDPGAWGISMSQDGTKAYIVNQSKGTISVINVLNDTILPTGISGFESLPTSIAPFTEAVH